MRIARLARHPHPRRNVTLTLGAVAAVQMIAVVTLDSATRPGYDPWRNWVSQLALGPQAWHGTLNVALCSLWLALYALALRRHTQPSAPTAGTPAAGAKPPATHSPHSPADQPDRRLGLDRRPATRPGRSPSRAAPWVLACAAGLALTAALPTDPGLGFPPGTPPATTLVGQLHQAAGILVFLTGLQATLKLGPRRYARIVATVMTLAFAAATILVLLDAYGIWPDTPSGLLERIALFTGLTWTGAAGLTVRRRRTTALPPSRPTAPDLPAS
ncbi:DUF998 domain-containing protein [Symbioplanes lichenis]|uniref:DUF998 domain-containing protein n=1 Tax=Symbioplanes lichenis TaxID=1629072 RepID=UPI0027397CD2|nr:DUF998 domain-containing protein [Actinoplanes lichenis]